jgi:ribonuclease P protein component
MSSSAALSPATLPATARLRQPADFARCLETGVRMGGALYRCTVRIDAEATLPRIGFAVSRKVDRRAVVRNRIKRIARDFFRRNREQLPAGDYVFMAKREAAIASRHELHRDLERLLPRLRALKPTAPRVTIAPDSASVPADRRDSEATDGQIPTSPAADALRRGDH